MQQQQQQRTARIVRDSFALLDELLQEQQQPAPAPAAVNDPSSGDIPLEFQAEARALRFAVLERLILKRGNTSVEQLKQRDYASAVAVSENHAKHLFVKHVNQPPECHGRDIQAEARLAEIRKLEQRSGKLIVSKELLEEKLSLQQRITRSCVLEHFGINQPFVDPAFPLQEPRLASGCVYICLQSGRIHICLLEYCGHRVISPDHESVICALTQKHYGQPMAHFESHQDDTKEGGVSGRVIKGQAIYAHRGSNATHYQDSFFDSQELPHQRARKKPSTGAAAAAAAAKLGLTGSAEGSSENVSSRRMQHRRENRDRSMNHAINGLGDCIIPDPNVPGRSLFETRMAALYPNDRPPEVPNTQRTEMWLLFKKLLFDSVVRQSTLNKLVACEQQALIDIDKSAVIVGDDSSRSSTMDVFLLAGDIHNYVGAHHRRMLELGWQDPPFEQEVLDYFFDCVLMLSKLLYYIGNAKHGAHLFKKYGIGLLYKLRSGIVYNVKCNTKTGEIIHTEDEEEGDEEEQQHQHQQQQPKVPPTLTSGPEPARPNLTELIARASLSRDSELDWNDTGPSCPPGTIAVCFVPRHPFLDRLPTLDELNRFQEFESIGSCTIVDSSRFFSDCYKSLLRNRQFTHVQQLLPYTLGPYINLKHHPRPVSLLPPAT